MRKHNPENEVAKREYLAWLKNAKGRHPSTLDQTAAALHAFEAYTRYASFKSFRREKAIAFKEHLAEQTNPRTVKPLSRATCHATLSILSSFFEWLSREPGYRRDLQASDAAYFNLSANDARVATARRDPRYPSVAQVLHVIETMPADTVIARRDRAVVAFILLCGARDSAVASLRLKHIDLANQKVSQDPREVMTKRAKTFTSYFYPVGDLPLQVVGDWVRELLEDRLFGPTDPLFPSTKPGIGKDGCVQAAELTRQPWASAQPIRAIFKRAFEAAGLSYFHPHSIRHTLAHRAYELKLSPQELKAWSQNLGHDSVLTTLTSYGALSAHEQADAMDRIRQRSTKTADLDKDALLREFAELLKRAG